jgi:hypothetical protein
MRETASGPFGAGTERRPDAPASASTATAEASLVGTDRLNVVTRMAVGLYSHLTAREDADADKDAEAHDVPPAQLA